MRFVGFRIAGIALQRLGFQVRDGDVAKFARAVAFQFSELQVKSVKNVRVQSSLEIAKQIVEPAVAPYRIILDRDDHVARLAATLRPNLDGR